MRKLDKTVIKDLALMILIPALLILIVCTYDDGTHYSSADVARFEEQARQEGYDQGYNEGYYDGYEKGHIDGYNEGYGE